MFSAHEHCCKAPTALIPKSEKSRSEKSEKFEKLQEALLSGDNPITSRKTGQRPERISEVRRAKRKISETKSKTNSKKQDNKS